VYVRTDPDQVEAVYDVLAATADPERPEEVQVSQPSDALTARAAAKSAFNSLFLGLGAVAYWSAGSASPTSWSSRHSSDAARSALRRALGATKRHVRTQFLTESLLLATLGGIGGVAIGAAVTAAYATSRDWQVVIPASSVAAGLGAALPPAWRPLKRCVRSSPEGGKPELATLINEAASDACATVDHTPRSRLMRRPLTQPARRSNLAGPSSG
jgi:predicted lysophospholipase L1 biosynthesis ABC-type transport system permease subunit